MPPGTRAFPSCGRLAEHTPNRVPWDVADHVRILLLADSHLGFDLPSRPRVDRRRRGHDFLANYGAALAPALAGDVDLVVHGGDVFNRSSVLPTVAWQAFEPLRDVAARGVPVFIVPGNHERSRLPHARFARHPLVHVFDRPRTFVIDVAGGRVALSGFPYERHDVRSRFPSVVEATEWTRVPADVRLLCMHHCVEGATVGPGDFTFTTAADVIRAQDLPAGFAAVLSGHIHRHQVLMHDLRGQPLTAPVCYPGSIERTSIAESGETKGFLILRVGDERSDDAVRWSFCPLPARPMIRRDLVAADMTGAALQAAIEDAIGSAPTDAVLSVRVTGPLTDAHARVINSGRLRSMAPGTMNVEVVLAGRTLPAKRPRRAPAAPAPDLFA